ncbi:hypothetical protein ASF82_07240 [Frigoribacterium sp. Leaf164]|uniref:hypothetical protein n=1 Tax=Frigoribacterium sp. Leaf164 TaxID=1736282 RepID=UPI0006FCD29D|nr:hypothetical protein [Frigoribacterium sp. Leaf164]KQR47121.1 hypothetical protein ASF82_07240 [Frigoribacterium sp. Leaf164]
MAERPTRTDLVFLRRRVKPQVAVPDLPATPAPAPAPAPVSAPVSVARPAPAPEARVGDPGRASSGLSLGGPRSSTPPAASSASGATGPTCPARPARPSRPAPFPAPDVTDVRELSRDQPVVRLSPRRSAIGTLVVTGGVHAVWESTELVDGAAFSTGQRMGDVVTTSGNRPLVAFDGDEVLVTLRHVRELRRALVVAGDGAWLQVQLPGDRRLSVDPAEPGERVALAMLVVDGLLELRRVTLPDTLTPPLVHQRFGYSIPERPGDSAPNGR